MKPTLVRDSKNLELATFFPGVVCNLACATCGPQSSSKWQKLRNSYTDRVFPDFNVDSLDLSGIRSIVICGGEPILNDSTKQLVKRLINTDIFLIVHFNGTVLPDQDFLNDCARFKRKIGFRFSIDGIGDRFDYLRWPAKWHKVEENLFWFRDNAPDNVEFGINITLSVLNELSYQDVFDWVTNKFSHTRSGLSISCDTQIGGGGPRGPFTDPYTLKYFSSIDKIRNTNWKEVFPEIYKKYSNEYKDV